MILPKTILSTCILLAAIVGCKKSDPVINEIKTPPVVIIPAKPSITSTSPARVLPNSTLTITGKNFPTATGKVAVNFGSVAATVASVTATQIVVHVPAAAKSGPVIAVLDGSALVAALDVTVLSGTQSACDYTNYVEYFASDALGNVYSDSRNSIYKNSPGGASSLFIRSVAGTPEEFSVISGLAFDALGNVYFTDRVKNKIFKVTPAGAISTFAGTGVAGYADGPGTTAQFAYLSGLAIDASGNLYTATNGRIRKISNTGQVSTFTGQALSGYVDGPASVAKFGSVSWIVIDKENNLLLSDATNHVIRKVTPAGVTSTFAGTGAEGWDDGTVKTATFRWVQGMAFNANGDLFVSDNYFNPGRASKIRMINKAGLVTTFMNGDFSTSHVLSGTLNVASVMFPNGLAFNAAGDMYIAQTGDGCRTIVTFN